MSESGRIGHLLGVVKLKHAKEQPAVVGGKVVDKEFLHIVQG